VIRLPGEIGGLSDYESWDVVVERAAGTPAAPLVAEVPRDAHADPPPLSRRQWGNVALVVLFSQGLQVFLVSAMVFVFLFVFGVIVVTEPVVGSRTRRRTCSRPSTSGAGSSSSPRSCCA